MENYHQKNFEKIIKKKYIKKILIVAGKNSYLKSNSKNYLENILKAKKLSFYFKFFFYPCLDEAILLKKKIKKENPDIIIAIGGGSVIDLAKVSNILDLSRTSLKNRKVFTTKPATKLIAIPLTAGSGAESTSTAVLYINKKKISVENDKVKPDSFYLIPHLILNSSKKIKGSSIFDCIAQAIESIFSKKSNSKSIKYAIKSLKISLKNWSLYYNKPNFNNAKNMLIAANFAGKAIDISRTIASHAISYPFTILYRISHGAAVSITLVKILEYNYYKINSLKRNKKKILSNYKKLFKLTGSNNINDLSRFLENIIFSLKLHKVKMKLKIQSDRKKIIEGINVKRLKNNPVKINNIDLNVLLSNISVK